MLNAAESKERDPAFKESQAGKEQTRAHAYAYAYACAPRYQVTCAQGLTGNGGSALAQQQMNCLLVSEGTK